MRKFAVFICLCIAILLLGAINLSIKIFSFIHRLLVKEGNQQNHGKLEKKEHFDYEMIEIGVMVMKNGKAWGIKYDDGHCQIEGWEDPINAPVHDPQYCKNTKDVT